MVLVLAPLDVSSIPTDNVLTVSMVVKLATVLLAALFAVLLFCFKMLVASPAVVLDIINQASLA
jgi:hypothetical protein